MLLGSLRFTDSAITFTTWLFDSVLVGEFTNRLVVGSLCGRSVVKSSVTKEVSQSRRFPVVRTLRPVFRKNQEVASLSILWCDFPKSRKIDATFDDPHRRGTVAL